MEQALIWISDGPGETRSSARRHRSAVKGVITRISLQRSDHSLTALLVVGFQDESRSDENKGKDDHITTDQSEPPRPAEPPEEQQQEWGESSELKELRDALQQAEQQNQLLNREYSQLLKEKEVGVMYLRQCYIVIF